MKIKKLLFFAALLIVAASAKAQDDYPIIYQAVVNDSDGKPVKKQHITVELSVCSDQKCSTVDWQGLDTATTNEFGLFTVALGSGTDLKGDYEKINWATLKYLRVRVDFGKSDFLDGMNDLGTNPFSAVPYAKSAKADAAKVAEKATNMVINDLTDVEATPSNGQVLTFDGSKWIAKAVTFDKIDAINKIDDVTISSPSNGQVLTFNSQTGHWVNLTPSKITKLEELTGDVDVSGKAEGKVLKYDGTKWKAAAEGSLWSYNDLKTAIRPATKVVVGSSSYTPSALFEVSDGSTKRVQINQDVISLPGGGCFMIGENSSATDISSGVAKTAIGAIAIYGSVDADHNFAFGINGNESTIMSSTGSFAFGKACKIASSHYSVAIGNSIRIKNYDNQFVCGKYNNSDQEAVFAVGNGTSDTQRSNAFYITNNGNATLTGVLSQSSDSRLKTNVNQISSALDKIVKLRGVTFYWDLTKKPSADQKLQYGFIAQEVEKVFPELVTSDSQGFKTLNYTGIIPVLTEAVKELKQENEELKSTVQDLIKRIEALERKGN